MSELSQSIQDDMRDIEGGWCDSFVKCCKCMRHWMAIHPVESDVASLQCPDCKQQGATVIVNSWPHGVED